MTAPQRLAYRRLFKNHSGQIGYWEGWVEGDATAAQIVLQYARILDGQVTRRIHPAYAKNVGRSNETTCLEQAQLELDSRTSKQKDKGYVERREDATAPSTNTLGRVRPMKGLTLEDVGPEKVEWHTAYAQPKLDGHRILSDGVLYSSGGKPYRLPHVEAAIEAAGLAHLHLDGEMYAHGKTLQEIASLVKRPREETLELSFHIFDVVGDEPWPERFAKLGVTETPAHWPHGLTVVPSIKVQDFAHLQQLHEAFLAQGYEGTMLRWGREGYQGGKKVKHLLKLKQFQDAEFTIVGVQRGVPYLTAQGTFEVPVWVCDAGNGKTFTCTAQGDMRNKHALWEDRQRCLGRALTVQYHYLSKEGIPQLPVALRFRADL